ncbi:MAG: adenosylmethionine--8-amino-7-oxononanoate transaminase [Acidimicrobiia bacterium]
MDEAAVWAKRDAGVVWHGFTQMSCFTESSPVLVEQAEGHELIDVDGNRYLDAISSLWVNTIGHRVPELDEAIREQLDRGAHSTMLGNGNRVVVELAEALAARVPVDQPHFLFASDGASAVEQALKIAFQYWVNLGVTGRTTFLAFGGAYHGDTIGALSVGDGGFGTDVFDPLRFPIYRAPQFADPGCFETAARMVAEHAHELAAVIVEPLVQGAAGMQLAPAGSFAVLDAACREHGVLLICDEVATGFGRTGTLFASEQCGLRPDLMAIGKGLTAGYLAQSATVASGRVFDAFLGPDLSEKTLSHGHSYSGNALACAVALRHLELLDEWRVLDNVRERSVELRALLDEQIAPLDVVRDVRLQGLMGGVELAPPTEGLKWGRRVCAEAVRRGVLLRPLGDVVVLMPPLTITSPELHRIVDTLESALHTLLASETCPDGRFPTPKAGAEGETT